MTDTPSIDRLIAIMARLRDPEDGCPWDLEQTFRSILPYTLEEAYEVAEAIEREDMASLRDELGDLLLQVVFHARMAEEGGHFAFADVVEAICDKMVRRHPHVFGAVELADSAAILAHWEQLKAAERAGAEAGEPNGILDGVARTLPALVRAEKLQRRAARVGFDWDAVSAVFDKVEEELAECRATLAEHADPTERVHEIGDLLFSCVNLARHMDVDAEQALRAANQRFERRFSQVERGLREQGLEPSLETREEMERQWTLAKTAERA
ncbi:nucleoside triphosphate pyrophosphohydrolase [Allochromatium palmeri]|uniref:Nucleoside triphosphate pyrophosphohydrolase n=1 Tax=Allochromatium palmeri TaxID=231048 RepID=A0A6N8EGS9_9GAMM|nr:nucleoside triphosphate pyrophosphohydrolase [Allochromatium palmeri]MTW21906.1 nucleoside triphosphate pyrophosphohydrolase [Allochromatium palmeri]